MKKIAIIMCFGVLFYSVAAAERIPVGQSVGSNVREYRDARSNTRIKNRLINPVIVPPALNADEISTLPGNKSRMRIEKIIVQCDRGVKVDLEDKRMTDLVDKYKGKQLSIVNMKNFAKQVAWIYETNESEVYVPEQSFAGNVMFINMVKGKE